MKKSVLIVGLVFVVIAVVVTFVLLRNRKGDGTSFPLQQGSEGEAVKKLQAALNKKNTAGIKIDEDGIFGPKTESLLVTVTGKTSITKQEYKKLIA